MMTSAGCASACGNKQPRGWEPGAGRTMPPGTFEDHVKDMACGSRRATLSELTNSLLLQVRRWTGAGPWSLPEPSGNISSARCVRRSKRCRCDGRATIHRTQSGNIGVQNRGALQRGALPTHANIFSNLYREVHGKMPAQFLRTRLLLSVAAVRRLTQNFVR